MNSYGERSYHLAIAAVDCNFESDYSQHWFCYVTVNLAEAAETWTKSIAIA